MGSILRIRLLEGLQYRLSALSGAVTSTFWALIEITVYTVFFHYADRASLPNISNGMALSQVVSYAWLGQFLAMSQPMNVDAAILAKIESGDVGVELCRPMDLYGNWFAQNVAARINPLWRGGPVLLAGLIMPASYRLGAPASLPGMLWMFHIFR
jgi:ABC-2 type transport system permease protein